MAETSIGLSREAKQTLRDERKPHESSYEETIMRLCGEQDEPWPTKEEVKQIAEETANEQISERVVPEAQR